MIILKRLLGTLSLNPHGNLDTGQETKPIVQIDDTTAQRDHMFTSELNGTYYLQQGAGFTLRKREMLSGRSKAQGEAAHNSKLD